ncbi:MAG TPA: hypothetical protein VM282_22240 [Acidimicrobiales bacterium]|nr:hypothetical protein [Acidimicrobiales bacterium]
MKRILIVAALTVALVSGISAQPASAVIHEIYSAWCAGKGEIVPPGLSDDQKKNFAAPVLAGGVVSLTPYLDGLLIDFDFDKPQAKIVPAPDGPAIIPIGDGLYLERFILDPDFPAFANCEKLQSLAG